MLLASQLIWESDPNPTPHSPCGCLPTTSPSAALAGPGSGGYSGFRITAEKGWGWRGEEGEREEEVAVGTEACSHSALGPLPFILSIYSWLLWVSVAVHRLPLVAVRQLLAAVRGLLVAGVWASCCSGVSVEHVL